MYDSKESGRRYRENHREKLRLKADKYRHSRKGRATIQAYCDSLHGKAVRLKATKAWKEQNPGRVRISDAKAHTKYNKTVKGCANHARSAYRRRSREAACKNDLSATEWQAILDKYNNCCVYCGTGFAETIPPTRDHQIPVKQGGGLTAANIVPACQSCNSRKGTKFALIPG